MTHVRAISLPERILITPSGETLPITNMFDYLGDETDDPRECYRVVAGPTLRGTWVASTVIEEERGVAGRLQ